MPENKNKQSPNKSPKPTSGNKKVEMNESVRPPKMKTDTRSDNGNK